MGNIGHRHIIFIVGGGYSAKQVLSRPDIKSHVESHRVIGCNTAAKDFRCDYLTYYDLSFYQRYRGLINAFDGVGGVYAPLSAKIGSDYKAKTNWVKNANDPSDNFDNGLYLGVNTGIMSISIAMALGYKEIYLIGMDNRHAESRRCLAEWAAGNNEYTCDGGCTDEEIKAGGERCVYKSNGARHYHNYYGAKELQQQQLGYPLWGFRRLGDWIRDNRPDINLYNCAETGVIDPGEEHGYKNIKTTDILNVKEYKRKREI